MQLTSPYNLTLQTVTCFATQLRAALAVRPDLFITGSTTTPVPDKMELSASAGNYYELSEPIESSGILALLMKLDKLSNGTNWAPGAMISFAKGGYENTLIFTVY
jgi:hypothetical protein